MRHSHTFGATPELLGFTRKGRPVYAISGADDGGGDGGTGDGGTGDGGTADGGTGGGGSGDLGDAGKRALDAEREARKAAEKRVADLDKKVKGYEAEKLTEQERLTKQASDAETAKVAAETELKRVRADRHIERAAAKAGFIDPEDAVLGLDRSKLKLEEDGTPEKDSLEKHLKGLAESKPHLVRGSNGRGSWDGGQRGKTTPPGTDMNQFIREKAGLG